MAPKVFVPARMTGRARGIHKSLGIGRPLRGAGQGLAAQCEELSYYFFFFAAFTGFLAAAFAGFFAAFLATAMDESP